MFRSLLELPGLGSEARRLIIWRMLGLRNFIRRLRSGQPGDDQGLRRGAENVDAMAAGGASEKGDAMGGANLGSDARSHVPPSYIKTYDDGRPRH